MTMPNNSNSRGVRRRRTSLLRNDYDQNIAPTIVMDAGIAQIDEPLMTLFCSYALSSNATIHKYGLNSLNNLLNILRDDNFTSNQRLVKKFHLAKKFLHERLNGITDRDLIISAANREMDVKAIMQDSKLFREISNDEVYYVENTVAEFQNNLYLNQHLAGMLESLTNYKNADYRQKTSLLPGIKQMASNLLTQFRRNEMNRDSSDTLFRLTNMESSIEDIHKYVTSPSFKLITGIQGLNAMFGGGLEKGNVYAFFGLPGEGKTVTLENMLYQLWKYNRGYECKDKTKRPCIVLLTMENFVRQTVCALYHIMTGGKNLRDCKTADEAIQEFKNHSFEFDVDDQNSIEIVIKYKPVNSVTTDYLYKIVEDLEDEGYECIAFLQDYVKRILPVLRTGDPYQDLGNVINEFKTFATLKDLPFITASQLNREAARMIDEGRNANKNDLIKKLGRSNIGESSRIDENLDCTMIITPEFASDGTKYMGIKLTKHRFEIYTNKVSIYQPYIAPDSIAMVEDVYASKPAYRESLMRDAEEIRASFGNIERASINKTVHSIAKLTSSMMRPGITSAVVKTYVTPSGKEITEEQSKKKQVMEFVEPSQEEKDTFAKEWLK